MSLTLSLLSGVLLGQSNSISSYWQSGLKDASFTAKVEKSQQKELQKINKDFASSYRFDYTDVKMKEPFKLRLESKVDDQSILYILNGPMRMFKIPRAGINKKENLAKSPGKRQTVFDFGLITPALFNNFMEAKFVRMDRATDMPVFDVTYEAALGDGSRHRIWIDTDKKIVSKREWYSQNGSKPLLAIFLYKDPVKYGTVWVPTTLEVQNAEGKFAGRTKYNSMKVNSGLADSLFDL